MKAPEATDYRRFIYEIKKAEFDELKKIIYPTYEQMCIAEVLLLILNDKVDNEAWKTFKKMYPSQLHNLMAKRTTEKALGAAVKERIQAIVKTQAYKKVAETNQTKSLLAIW